MDTVLKNEIRTARKEYHCDAWHYWVSGGLKPADCTDDAQRATLAAAEADAGHIKPGQKYRYVRGIFEGSMSTWRARADMEDLCRAHHLYEDY